MRCSILERFLAEKYGHNIIAEVVTPAVDFEPDFKKTIQKGYENL